MSVDIDVDGVEVNVGRQQPVAEIPDDPIGINYEVAPDGRSFYMAERDTAAPTLIELTLVLNWTEELKRLAPIP